MVSLYWESGAQIHREGESGDTPGTNSPCCHREFSRETTPLTPGHGLPGSVMMRKSFLLLKSPVCETLSLQLCRIITLSPGLFQSIPELSTENPSFSLLTQQKVSSIAIHTLVDVTLPWDMIGKPHDRKDTDTKYKPILATDGGGGHPHDLLLLCLTWYLVSNLC